MTTLNTLAGVGEPPLLHRTPTMGETVLYVLDSGPRKGEPRAAVVAGVDPDGVDLTVYLRPNLDAYADADPAGQPLLIHVEGATYGGKPGCWVWPTKQLGLGGGAAETAEPMSAIARPFGVVNGGVLGETPAAADSPGMLMDAMGDAAADAALAMTGSAAAAAIERARDLKWSARLLMALGNPPQLVASPPTTPDGWALALRSIIRVQPLAIQWVRFLSQCGNAVAGEEWAMTSHAARAFVELGAAEFIARPTFDPADRWAPVLLAVMAEPLALSAEAAADRVEAASGMIGLAGNPSGVGIGAGGVAEASPVGPRSAAEPVGVE